jgi:flagellar biosynthesis anti-sigma factor FlgM
MSIGPRANMSPVAGTSESTQSGSRAGSEISGAEMPSPESGLSPDAARVCELVAQVSQLPEMRREKVAAIKGALQDGSYRVSAEQMAEAVISELEARRRTGSAPGGTGNTMGDSGDEGRESAARISETAARQSRPETAPRTDDAASRPAREGDEPSENPETSGNQMDSVA